MSAFLTSKIEATGLTVGFASVVVLGHTTLVKSLTTILWRIKVRYSCLLKRSFLNLFPSPLR